MRHALTPRRGLARHRPRSRSLSRETPDAMRASDIVLALAGVAMLGAFALYAAIVLIGRGAPL